LPEGKCWGLDLRHRGSPRLRFGGYGACSSRANASAAPSRLQSEGSDAGVELATVDAHRAAEAAADDESGFDDRVAREARQNRFEIDDSAGRDSRHSL
jgi:hypothetical protein